MEEAEEEEETTFIALTGKFKHDHAALARLIEAQPGLSYTVSVTRACTCLVSQLPIEEYSVKVRAARRYDVPVREPAYLAELLGLEEI
jgi:hypothetical protein